MTSISPIFESSVPEFEELFDSDFQNKRIGQRGEWYGDGRMIMGLNRKVNYNDFHHLLKRLTPNGKSPLLTQPSLGETLLGWHVHFTAPGSVSVFWALAPPDLRKAIFAAHSKAASNFAGHIGHPWDDYHSDDPQLLFASFCYGASKQSIPELGAHVILINAGFKGSHERLAIADEGLFSRIFEFNHYESDLPMYLSAYVGDLRPENYRMPNYQIPAVPPELYKRPDAANPDQKPILQAERPAHLITPGALFSDWCVKAETFGWGPREVEGIIRCVRREKAYEEFHANAFLGSPFWKPKHYRVKEATDYLVRDQFIQRRRAATIEQARSKSIKSRL